MIRLQPRPILSEQEKLSEAEKQVKLCSDGDLPLYQSKVLQSKNTEAIFKRRRKVKSRPRLPSVTHNDSADAEMPLQKTRFCQRLFPSRIQ